MPAAPSGGLAVAAPPGLPPHREPRPDGVPEGGFPGGQRIHHGRVVRDDQGRAAHHTQVRRILRRRRAVVQPVVRPPPGDAGEGVVHQGQRRSGAGAVHVCCQEPVPIRVRERGGVDGGAAVGVRARRLVGQALVDHGEHLVAVVDARDLEWPAGVHADRQRAVHAEEAVARGGAVVRPGHAVDGERVVDIEREWPALVGRRRAVGVPEIGAGVGRWLRQGSWRRREETRSRTKCRKRIWSSASELDATRRAVCVHKRNVCASRVCSALLLKIGNGHGPW